MDEYERQCALVHGRRTLTRWNELRAVLEPRSKRGWYFAPAADRGSMSDPLWAFGLGGAALLVADVVEGRFHLFNHTADTDSYFDDVGAFAEALAPAEEANRGLTGLQKEILETVDLDPDSVENHYRELREQEEAFDSQP